jgi:hypothetical protein
MIIDNQKNLIRIRTQFFFIGFSFITLLTISIMSDFFILNLFVFERWIYVIFFIVVFGLILIYRNYMNYNYIYFNDESAKIIFRYHRIKMFERSYKSIEISKNTFINFEEKIFFFNQRHDIILHQRTNKGIAKYPSVSITALDKMQKKELIVSLNKIIATSNRN